MGSCTTVDTWCSVSIGSMAHCFCVDVLAVSPVMSARSPRHCFAGINEVKMYPPRFTRLATIPGKSRCLKLEWTEDMSTPLPSERDHRVIQIEYTTPHQAQSWKVSAALHDWRLALCALSPGTKYAVRLRAQDTRAPRHWSAWSGIREACTAESAPGAAPELWRHVQPPNKSGQRRLTLLWKPLQWPDANGVILHYAVSCWSDVDRSRWDCGHLDSSVTSCTISVSTHPCMCNLTASNSAGTSPVARVPIPGDKEAVLPPPGSISVTALDDFQLKVEWTATFDQSDASFVVEWRPITDSTLGSVYWKRLNVSARSFIITEGVFPEVPYNVSVQVLHEKATGAAICATGFSRQGAPSVGPKLKVQRIMGSSVILKWDAVPLEKLHGFVQNYTVLYVTNGKMKSQVLGGDVEQFLLTGLSAGEYAICVKAQTLAGSAEGQWITVAVGNDYVLIVAILCTIGGLLTLVIIVSQSERIQRRLWPIIPNPSRSSLKAWACGCQSQHKKSALEFIPPPSLSDLIYLGRMAGHRDPPHEEQHQACPFSDHSVPSQPVDQETQPLVIFPRSLIAKKAEQESGQPHHELNVEEPAEDLITERSYRSNVMAQPQTLLVPSASPPTLSPCLRRDMVYPLLDERSLMASLRLYGQSLTAPEAWARVDKVDSSKLLHKKDFTSRSESSCCPSVAYTRYLPASELQLDFRKEAKDFTNLIHKSNLLSPLESCCMHISTTYLAGPQSPLAYASIQMETGQLADCSPSSKTDSSSQINLSTIYVPVSRTHSSLPMEALDSANFLKKIILSGPECSHQYACQSTPTCKEFEVENTYRTLSPEESAMQLLQ